MRPWTTLLLACTLAFGQTVEESFTRDPGPLDLVRGEGHEQAILQALAADALTGLGAGGRPVPRLAARWERMPWGLRFHLRQAVFADGSPVTAADVCWTFAEIQRRAEASPTKRAILDGLRVEGAGDRVDLRSDRPVERLLLELARVPVAKAGHPEIGSGPYTVQRNGQEILLRARAHFLAPRIPGFRFRMVGDPQAMLHWLQKGWLSIGVPPVRTGLQPPPTHRELILPTHAQLVVWSRSGPGPLRWMQRWRSDAFPPAVLGKGAAPSRGLWPESLGFPTATLAGTPPSPGREPWELLYPAGDEFISKILLALRERAGRDGVALALRPVEPALLYERLQRGQYGLACMLALFDPHPWSVLEYLEPNGPMNFSQWSHPALAELRPRLGAADGPAWRRLQETWAGSAAALPLLDYRSVVWIDRRLAVEAGPLGLYLGTPGPCGWRWTP